MKNILFAVVLLLAICNPLQAQYLKTGYRGMVEIGGGTNFARYDCLCAPPTGSHFELSTTHGYQFSPYLFLGAGVGMQIKDLTQNNFNLGLDFDALIPVFVDFRANFNKKKISPFGLFRLGYLANTNKDLNGGVYLNPSLGYRFGIYKKLAINVSLGYLFQQLDYIYLLPASRGMWEWPTYTQKKSRAEISAFTLKAGFEF